MGKDALQRAIDHCGGQSGLARAIGNGVTQSHVWNWLNRSAEVPASRVVDIERATGGAVTRRELRPDLFAEVAA